MGLFLPIDYIRIIRTKKQRTRMVCWKEKADGNKVYSKKAEQFNFLTLQTKLKKLK